MHESGQEISGTILVGNLSKMSVGIDFWKVLLKRIAMGNIAVFLSPFAFRHGDKSTGWLPLLKKGRCYKFHDWVYHKECVAKIHPLFEGLQSCGICDGI